MNSKKQTIKVKPYTIMELARFYEVDWRTFKKWIKPFEGELGPKYGRFFTIPQVKLIFDKLSLPSSIELD